MFDFSLPKNDWTSLLVVVSGIGLAILAHFLLFKLLQRSAAYKKEERIRTITSQLYAPVRVILIMVFIFLTYPWLENIIGAISSSIRHFLAIILIITIAWLTIKLIRAGRIIAMRKYDLEVKDNYLARRAFTQFRMIENILIFLVVIVAIGIALMTFEAVRQVGIGLLTSAGIAGIILGFAAQKLIATILAGIQIAITHPISIDDVVIVENEWGRIEEITLTYVVVRIWDQRRLIVPTIYFIENPFQNWTRKTAELMGTVFIYTDYTVPTQKVREELTRLLESTDLWDGRVNVLQVTDTKERSLELRALVSAKDSSTAWDLRVFIREKLVDFIQREYPQSLPRTRITFDAVDMGYHEE